MAEQWVRTAFAEGRIIGEFTSQDAAARPMVVIQTLDGQSVAPRDSLITIDHQYLAGSLSHRIEDVLAAARKAGWSSEIITEAVRQAMHRQDVSLDG